MSIGLKMDPSLKRGMNTSLILSNNCAIVELCGGLWNTKSVFLKGKGFPPFSLRRRFNCGDEDPVAEGKVDGIDPPPIVMLSLSAAQTRRLVTIFRARWNSFIFWGSVELCWERRRGGGLSRMEDRLTQVAALIGGGGRGVGVAAAQVVAW